MFWLLVGMPKGLVSVCLSKDPGRNDVPVAVWGLLRSRYPVTSPGSLSHYRVVAKWAKETWESQEKIGP